VRWQISAVSGGGSVNMTAVASNIVPAHNEVYDLGHSAYRWRDLYLSGSSLWLGNIKIVAGASGLQTINQAGNIVPIAGGSKFTLSSTPPATPQLGDRWMNSETYKEFIRRTQTANNGFNLQVTAVYLVPLVLQV
jgi:hypothetical protein